jgi:hypothetical protein
VDDKQEGGNIGYAFASGKSKKQWHPLMAFGDN